MFFLLIFPTGERKLRPMTLSWIRSNWTTLLVLNI